MDIHCLGISPAPLACFSPPVMISTFAIEFGLAFYVWMNSGSGLFRNLVVAVLFCLSSFQLAEYFVCDGPAANALLWTKVGLVGISFLPAMGMHVLGVLTRPSLLVPLGYAMATAYSVIFLFVPGATGPAECHGNYVLLDIQRGPVGHVYDAYYSIFLLLAILELVLRLRSPNPMASGYSHHLIALMLLGYLSFTIPMAIVALISSHLRDATPSIMCGFALFLALLLAFVISPVYDKETTRKGLTS